MQYLTKKSPYVILIFFKRSNYFAIDVVSLEGILHDSQGNIYALQDDVR